jgi:hypothetical protein
MGRKNQEMISHTCWCSCSKSTLAPVSSNHRSDASKGCIDALMPSLDLCFNEVFFNTFSWIFTDSSIHKLAHRYWALFHFRSKHEHSTKR